MWDMIRTLLTEAERIMKEEPRILLDLDKSSKDEEQYKILVLSFLADLTNLCFLDHPYLKRLLKIIAHMLNQLILRKTLVIRDAIHVADGNRYERWIKVMRCLRLLHDTGMITQTPLGKYEPSDLLKSIAPYLEQVIITEGPRVEVKIPPRIIECLVGLILLKGVENTAMWLIEGANGEPKGVIHLYPVDSGGRVFIPKKAMATLMFVLYAWYRGWREFSELDTRAYLRQRLPDSEVKDILSWLCKTYPGHRHKFIAVHHGDDEFRFSINEEYMRLRERLRERLRDRGRG